MLRTTDCAIAACRLSGLSFHVFPIAEIYCIKSCEVCQRIFEDIMLFDMMVSDILLQMRIIMEENMKKTLIVVDMQNDFIDGSLGTKEAQAIVGNVKRKIEEYQARGDEIIFTRDTHQEDYLDTPEGKKLPVKHCIYGTKGWEIAEGLAVEGGIYIDKPTFGWVHWDERSFGEIELVGLCTDICVVSNALILKAMFPEVEITVDASCCAGVTPETHRAALETMKMCQIRVVGA